MKLYANKSYLELSNSLMEKLKNKATERTTLQSKDFPFLLRSIINKISSLSSKINIMEIIVDESSVDEELEKLIEDMKETLKPFDDIESIKFLVAEMKRELHVLYVQYEHMIHKLRNTHVFKV